MCFWEPPPPTPYTVLADSTELTSTQLSGPEQDGRGEGSGKPGERSFEPLSLSEVSFGLLGAGFREGRQMEERAAVAGRWVGERVGSLGRGVCTNRFFPLLAVVNSTGSNSSRLIFGGTMGSNALSFSGGPGALRAYSIKTTSTTRRGTHN